MQENIDYELVPLDDDDHWQIRIKTGDFIETMFSFGKLQVVDEEYLNFSYDLIYSPIDGLDEEDPALQEIVKKILISVMDSALGHIKL